MLEYLYDNNLPVDVSTGSIIPLPPCPCAAPTDCFEKLVALPDDRYLFKEISQEEADWQGVFYETCDGIEVPFSGRPLSSLITRPQTLPLEASKRKADGQPVGQPPAKIAAMAKDEDAAVAPMARHTASLLGAVEALEESAANTPDSASTPPTPPADDAIPEPRSIGEPTPTDGPELPLPRGASSPDEYGVRLISRRPTRMDVPNNRIMVPNLFEWDEIDIGFRDSTNCAQKGATKQRRGKYLGKPGSNYMFIDRRVGIWDSTLADGELDEELVKKHNLHPTLGIFLPNSINEAEPPKPLVSGWKPVVLVPPAGDPIHASRTIQDARMDRENERVEDKMHMAQVTRQFCEQEGISESEVAPSPARLERNRSKKLAARGINPAHHVVRPEPSPVPSEPDREDAARFLESVEDILRAADTVEAEAEAEAQAARVAAAKRPPPSRPYDAIRDVFTDSPPTRQPSPPVVQDVRVPVPAATDTTGLSCLADAALAPPNPMPPTEPNPPADPPRYNQLPNGVVTNGYGQPEYHGPTEAARPEPLHPLPQNGPSLPIEPARPNDFLRTALNPQSPTYPPPAPPPPPAPASPAGAAGAAGPPLREYPSIAVASAPGPPPPTQPPPAMASRTPFSSTGTTKSLPALRPMRNLLNEPLPEPQGGQALQHNMLVSNSGAYFPPAPSRPYHNPHSIQEPMQPTHPAMPQQPLANPLHAPPLAGPLLASAPPRQMSPYSVSPPPYHQAIAPSLGSALAQVTAPPAMPPHGVQPSVAAAAVQSSRPRPGSSSAPSAANPPSAAKYRKLEPAPTPPHRLAYAANGQELRTVPFDYREGIKDYPAVEAPPRHGPTQIRGWTHNHLRKTKPASSSKGDANANSSSDKHS